MPCCVLSSSDTMFSGFHLSTRPLLSAGVLYLAIPPFLFLLGWLQLFVAVPLCIALVYGLYACIRQLPQQRLSLHGTKTAALLFLSVLCLLMALLCGFTGHFQQHADFMVRNAVYERLIVADWPLTADSGQPFIYYFGHWLPPALVASFCPSSWASWILTLWTFLGMELTLLIAVSRWGFRQTVCWSLILFCLSSPLVALECLGVPLSAWLADYHAQLVLLIGMPAQLFHTFNHAIPSLLCTTLLLTRSLPAAGCYFIGALLLVSSPIGAILLLAYIINESLFRNPSVSPLPSRLYNLLAQPVCWIAFFYTIIMAVFYSHLDGGGQFTCLFSGSYAELYHYGDNNLQLYPCSVKYVSFSLALALGVFLPGLLLFPKCHKNPLYGITLALMASCLFFRTGIMNNELLFKAPAVLYPFLALLFIHALREGTAPYRALLMVYLLCSSLPSLMCIIEQTATFSSQPVSMHQNRQPADQTIFSNSPTPVSRQFMKKADCHLPSWLFNNKTKP